MASLMYGSLTTSYPRVQGRSSALYRQKQLRQAGVAEAEKNFALKNENERLHS